jgi:hypothetical protein
MNTKDLEAFEKWLYENKELRKTLENIETK